LTKIKAERGYKSVGVLGSVFALAPSTSLTLGDRYCFGGGVSVRIAQLDAITSIALAHPGPLTLAGIKAINVCAT